MVQKLPSRSHRGLFERIAEGNMEAFREVFDAYNKRIFAAAFKLTKSRTSAEDIVQDVFVALWEGRKNFGEVENPDAYLFTMAYNKTHRYLKKTASDNRLYESLKRRLKIAHQSTEELLDFRETAGIIDQEVAKLPSKRQLIYRLSRVEGLSHQQIAEQLNISPLTVKKQIVLALQQIRRVLSDVAPVIALYFFWK